MQLQNNNTTPITIHPLAFIPQAETETKKNSMAVNLCWFLLGAALVAGNIAEHSIIFQASTIIFMFVCLSYLFLHYALRINKYQMIIFIFIVYNYALIASGRAAVPEHSIKMVETVTINLILSVLLFSFFVYINDVHKVIHTYIIASVVSNIVILFAFRNSLFSGRLAFSWGDSISYYSLFGMQVVSVGPNIIAYFSAVSFIFATYYYFKNRKLRYLLLDFLFVFTILATGSRKGLLILVLGFFLLLNVIFKRNKKIIYFTIAFFLCSLMFYVIRTIPQLYETVGSRMDELLNLVLNKDVSDPSILTRMRLIDIGYTIYLQNPVFGYGLDAFRLIGPWKIVTDNNYLEILISSGIIGFIIYYSYVIFVLKDYFSIRQRSDICKILFGVFLLSLVMEYGSVVYFVRNIDFTHIMLFYVLFVGKKELSDEITENETIPA